MYESSSFKTKNGQPHVVSNLYDFYLWTQEEKFRRMFQVLFFIQKKWMGTNVVKLKKDKNSFLYVIHTPFLILYTSLGVDRLSAPILSILPIIDIGHFKNRFADNFFFFLCKQTYYLQVTLFIGE